MIYLVRFRDLLDSYVRCVFEGLDGGFAKNSAGEYVCGKDVFGSKTFREGLEKYILSKTPAKTNGLAADYFFIIGDCRPAENILLDLDGVKYKGTRSKYRLAEQDIKIDLQSFNRAADFVFSRLFRRKAAMPRNVFAVSHIRLGSATLELFMKRLFGNVNCHDIDVISPHGRCLFAANDDIEVKTKDKFRLNSSSGTKNIMTALKQYVEECTGMCWS